MFHALVRQFNINVKATLGDSPWSIGIIERHNAVLGKMINKSILDENSKLDVIVAWVVNSRNALHTCYG